MLRISLRFAAVLPVLMATVGCESLWDKPAPAYTYNKNTQTIDPVNDRDYWNGQPMDMRTTAPATSAGRRSP